MTPAPLPTGVVRVEVTPEDIEAGEREARPALRGHGITDVSKCCPVHHALRRVFTGQDFFVEGSYVAFLSVARPDRPLMPLEVDLPLEVTRWVGRFDEGLPVEPMAFEMEMPS